MSPPRGGRATASERRRGGGRGRGRRWPAPGAAAALLVAGLGLGLLAAPASAYYKPAVPKNGQPPAGGRPGPPVINPLLAARRRQQQQQQQQQQRRQAPSQASATAAAATEGQRKKLLGASKFVRQNPKSDRFKVLGFHHIEFYCGDATNTYRRFQLGLGMNLVAKSDLSTGNSRFASYCLRSHGLRFVFTAPYAVDSMGGSSGNGAATAAGQQQQQEEGQQCHPGFDAQHACDFFRRHGTAARAIGLEVADAAQAYEACIAHGGQAALAPVRLPCPDEKGGYAKVAEVRVYGDVVLRFLSRHDGFDGEFLPAYRAVGPAAKPLDYGLERLDHAVGNVWDLLEAVDYVGRMTGFHEFAEFTADDVGTTESGLNSIVLATNDERVLIPMNEPTYGTKRKSQIQTYLEYNNGPGLQHLALATRDVFATVRRMREVGELGGFEFQERPNPQYYRDLPGRLGDALTPEQYRLVEELGLLADKDDQGVLLQVFTKPVGDRPTLFLEIIQRIGCQEADPEDPGKVVQRGGCGGFGKGNFKALFESIERYERELKLS